jgi:hypothetical protein
MSFLFNFISYSFRSSITILSNRRTNMKISLKVSIEVLTEAHVYMGQLTCSYTYTRLNKFVKSLRNILLLIRFSFLPCHPSSKPTIYFPLISLREHLHTLTTKSQKQLEFEQRGPITNSLLLANCSGQTHMEYR